MGEVALAKLLDIAFTLVEAGFERTSVVTTVREMEAAGATADQITDSLVKMRGDTEDAAQAAIDKLS